MIYATQIENLTIVAAADSPAELEQFHTNVGEEHFDLMFIPDFMEMLSDARFSNMRLPPYCFNHTDVTQRDAFKAHHALQIVPDFYLLDKQKIMLGSIEVDPYKAGVDDRSLAEIYSLTENDPWDTRSEEQKAKDETHKAMAEEARKAGKLTSDSFGGAAPSDSNVRVTDVRAHRDADGNVVIHDVIAVKGNAVANRMDEQPVQKIEEAVPNEQFYKFQTKHGIAFLPKCLQWLGFESDEEYTKIVAASSPLIDAEGWFVLRGEMIASMVSGMLDHLNIEYSVDVVNANLDVVGEYEVNEALAQQIDPDGMIAIYHRIDVPGGDLAEVIAVLRDGLGDEKLFVTARGQFRDYCWVVAKTKVVAERFASILKAQKDYASTEIEVYGVNDVGERLVPKGVEILEEEEVPVLPRPWNNRSGEIATMTDDERKENDKSLRGEEFLFCGTYHGAQDGVIFFITPRSYFNETGEMWGELLDLGKLNLPADFRQEKPGVFRTRSRDWLTVNHILTVHGLIESLGLQLYRNCL